jgi:glycosyltransferase involved in cell wall biosynthesis
MIKFDYDVVIPTFNRPVELLDSTKSIIHQTVPPNKIIIVNDGSSSCYEDSLSALLTMLVQTTIKLEWIDLPENRGVSAARNCGIEKASSTYIAFNDDDDIWIAEKSEIVANFFEQNPTIDVTFHSIATPKGDGELNESLPQRKITLWSLAIRNPLPIQAMFARRTSIGNVRFDEKLSHSEDYDFAIKLIETGLMVSKISGLLSQRVRALCSPGGLSESRMKMRKGELSAKTAFLIRAKSASHLGAGTVMLMIALFKVCAGYCTLAIKKT